MNEKQRLELVQWFLPQLEQAWDDELTGSAQVLGQRYVQWAGHGIGLQLECSSNNVLTGSDRLGAHQVARLRDLGWHAPAGDDLPNHWRVFFDRDALKDAAHALVDAVEVLKVPLFVPTPAPGPPKPEPAAEQPGRLIVVVPVTKVDLRHVAVARDAVVQAAGACVVVDHSRSEPSSALPQARFDEIVTAPQGPRDAVAVETGLLVQTGDIRIGARTLGSALDRVGRLLRRGFDVVLVLPSLPFELRWLYGSMLAHSHVVVFALVDYDDSHMSAYTLLDAVKPLSHGPVLLGVASGLEGSVLGMLGDFNSVVSERDASLRGQALSRLVQGVWERDLSWPPPELEESLLQAALVPLVSRFGHLPRRLECAHDVQGALRLLSDVLRAVQEHLEHVQDVGFGSLGELLALFALFEEAGRRGVAGVELAAAAIRWLAECGADGAGPLRAAAAAVARPAPAPGLSLSELLDDLDADPAIRECVDALAVAHSPLIDRRKDYVSLRPAQGGAIAIYVHRNTLSLALPAQVAPQMLAAVPGASLQPAASTTAYLRIPAASIAAQSQQVLMVCAHAFAWRAMKPGGLS